MTWKGDARMAGACRALYDGRITGDEFVRVTRDEWRRIAAGLVRRWKPPSWMHAEDVVQELLVAALDLVWKFDVARGASIGKYVVWNAIVEAKHALHVARGVSTHGNPDRKKSRFERPFSAFAKEGADLDEASSAIDRLIANAGLGDLGEQEHRAQEGARVRDAVAACSTMAEMVAIKTLAEEGSYELAAEAILGSRSKRRLARVKTPAAAVRFLDRTAERVAARLEERAA